MISDIINFLKKDVILSVSLAAAIISSALVRPDSQYIRYIDFRTLALLYALMVVVAGLRSAGCFDVMAQKLCKTAHSTRSLGVVLVMLCFVSSMLITNDVALLTFVPFSMVVLNLAGQRNKVALVVVLQTVAANLGSMLTPVGNPQNLYIYSYYDIEAFEFLKMTAPVWVISLVLVLLACFAIKKEPIENRVESTATLKKNTLLTYGALFLVCLLAVVRILSWQAMLIIVILVLAILERKMLLRADFMLLLTFVCFFIFAGNMARVPAVYDFFSGLLCGHELLVGAGLSQIISNVPATLLLAGFTDNAKELLLGVDIGGLGTPVASLASLIGLKSYMVNKGAKISDFLGKFLVINFSLLVILLIIFH